MSDDSTFWKLGQPLKATAVGSPVHYRSRGKWHDGVIEFVNERYVRVRLPNGRAQGFRRFYRDGDHVWLTGNRGHSRTQLHPGTSAEWEVVLAALLAERETKA